MKAVSTPDTVRALYRALEPLRNPLRQPEEAVRRRHYQDRGADPREHRRHSRRRHLPAEVASMGAEGARECRPDRFAGARDHGHYAVLAAPDPSDSCFAVERTAGGNGQPCFGVAVLRLRNRFTCQGFAFTARPELQFRFVRTFGKPEQVPTLVSNAGGPQRRS